MAVDDLKIRLNQAFKDGDIKAVCSLGPKEGDYADLDPVMVAIAVVRDILSTNSNDFLNEAISLLTYIQSCFHDNHCGKQYIQLLVDLKVKACLHMFLKLDPELTDSVTELIHTYFDPQLFQHLPVESVSCPVVYSNESSYCAQMHKLAHDGLVESNLQQSVGKFRQMDFTAQDKKLIKSLDSYLSWIKSEIKQVSRQSSVSSGQLSGEMDQSQEKFNLVLPENPLQHTPSQPPLPETQASADSPSPPQPHKPPHNFFYENNTLSQNTQVEGLTPSPQTATPPDPQVVSGTSSGGTKEATEMSEDPLANIVSELTVIEEVFPITQLVDVGSISDVINYAPVDIPPSASQMVQPNSLPSAGTVTGAQVEAGKKKRGRPRKPVKTVKTRVPANVTPSKRKRGRPRKWVPTSADSGEGATPVRASPQEVTRHQDFMSPHIPLCANSSARPPVSPSGDTEASSIVPSSI